MHLEASNVLRALSVPLKKLFTGLVFTRSFFFFHGLKITGFGLEDIVRVLMPKNYPSLSLFSLYDLFLVNKQKQQKKPHNLAAKLYTKRNTKK